MARRRGRRGGGDRAVQQSAALLHGRAAAPLAQHQLQGGRAACGTQTAGGVWHIDRVRRVPHTPRAACGTQTACGVWRTNKCVAIAAATMVRAGPRRAGPRRLRSPPHSGAGGLQDEPRPHLTVSDPTRPHVHVHVHDNRCDPM
eukprot:1362752-Prymnesium_polylepis.1